MAFTYTGDVDTPLEKVRNYIGDVYADDVQLQDGEINFLILSEVESGDVLEATQRDIEKAAVAACRTIAARYARRVTLSGEGFSGQFSDRHRHYLSLARELESQFGIKGVGGVPIFTGATNGRGGLVGPVFSRGMFDNPGSGLFDSDNRA